MEPKSIQNRSKSEVQDGMPLGIDFLWISMGLGSQLGRENRPKIDQKSIPKGIRKMIGKNGPLGSVLEASWGSKIHRSRLHAAARGCTRLHAGAVAETQGPLLGRIPKDFDYKKRYIKKVRKDRRLEYGTPSAMRRHKAWRGGARHRA